MGILSSIVGGIVGGIIALSGSYLIERYRDWNKRCNEHQNQLINSLKKWLYPNGVAVGGRGYPIKCPSPPRDFDKYVTQH